MIVVHLDFEASGVTELRKVGADVWTRRKDTYPTVLSFAINDDPVDTLVFDSRNHHRSTARVKERLAIVRDPGTELHAWNAGFEFMVWNNICVPRFNWPAIPIDRFHCTMARAACAGLPMSLEQASEAAQTGHVKDMVGARNMKRMAKPRRADPTEWWHLCQDDLAQTNLDALIAYNRADVEAERAIHQMTPRMTQEERRIWLVDQKMQAAGLPIDAEFLEKLAALTEQELAWLNFRLDVNTASQVTSFTQHKRLLEWLQARGYQLSTLEKDAVAAYLRSPEFKQLPALAQEVLQLRSEAAKTSVAKLNAIRGFAQIDGSCRHLSQYGGAVRTLRWAGRGPQIQNFPRPLFEDVQGAGDAIRAGVDAQALSLIWGRPLDVVSTCLRSVFCASPGQKFVVCDYSAIEARVVAWLAHHGDMLQVFQDPKQDIYVFMAAQQGSRSRQFGKVLVLACGYGMGGPKFQETALKFGVELTFNEAMQAVNSWRRANWPIVNLWAHCQQQAINAIQNPSRGFDVTDRLGFRMGKPDKKLRGALLMRLPSQRNLVYRNARIEDGEIIYDGVNQYTRKWEVIRTYGGKLVENATQAMARDLLADAIVGLDDIGWGDALRQTVHDEIIALADDDDAQLLLEKMQWVMRHPRSWASGLPLAVTGYVNQRYTKG